jgi:hypothetical protein
VPSEQLQNELKQAMAGGGQAIRSKKGAVPEISLSKSVISESDQDEEEEEKISINGASPPAKTGKLKGYGAHQKKRSR